TCTQAMKKGAVDFLLKPFDGGELIAAVARALVRGKECLQRRVERRDARGRIDKLTPLEFEVLRFVIMGLLNKKLAGESETAEVVCLVDDDLAILKSIGRLLASDGLLVRAFSRPQDFLRYVHVHLVPLVVLDILMEGMTGLEVQAQLRELSPSTRVIIMTGRE